VSHKKPAGQLRRELLMLMIRHSSDGLWVGGHYPIGEDLKRLVAEGEVLIVREQIKFDRKATEMDGRVFMRPGAKTSKAIPKDGVYLTSHPICPCCGASSYSFKSMAHTISCSLRLDHRNDAKRKNGKISKTAHQQYRFQ
jgi:hypothetical protein